MTDNFNLRKYLVENKVTTNSKMLNEEVETYNVGDFHGNYNEAEEEFLFPAMLDAGEWMVSQGIDPELADELEFDGLEGAWQAVQDETGKDYPLICIFKGEGDMWIDEEKAYDLGDGNVAIVEDYASTFMVVPKAAFEKFKQAVTSQNESMHSKQPRRKPVKKSDSKM